MADQISLPGQHRAFAIGQYAEEIVDFGQRKLDMDQRQQAQQVQFQAQQAQQQQFQAQQPGQPPMSTQPQAPPLGGPSSSYPVPRYRPTTATAAGADDDTAPSSVSEAVVPSATASRPRSGSSGGGLASTVRRSGSFAKLLTPLVSLRFVPLFIGI